MERIALADDRPIAVRISASDWAEGGLLPEESIAMASLTLKGMPDGLLKRLRGVAEINRRSLNREVLERLERSLESRRVDPETLLARADALRQRLALKPLDDASILRAKRAGRP